MNKIYKELTDLYGAAGYEHEVRAYLRNKFSKINNIEIIQDNLGSIFAVKKSKNPDAPTVMFAGHMDEVGAMVKGITKQGMIKMHNLGGVDYATFVAQKMALITNDKTYYGITSSTPPHLGGNTGKKTFKDLLLDIGASTKEEVEKLGIKPGQQIVPVNSYMDMTKNTVCAKAWDNRLGTGMSIEILEKLQDVELDCNLVIGATVQEEVGLRGARTATQMIKPDIFIAIDCSPANDYTGVSEDKINGVLGEGFLLRILDPSCVMHRGMREYITNLADSKKIKYQTYVSAGGTDAAQAQYADKGVAVATFGCPSRYIHSPYSIIHKNDVKQILNMSLEFIKSINKDTLKEIQDNV